MQKLKQWETERWNKHLEKCEEAMQRQDIGDTQNPRTSWTERLCCPKLRSHYNLSRNFQGAL